MTNYYKAGPVGTGLVATTNGSATVTGSGTAFLSQYQAGDTIIVYYLASYYYRTVLSVASDTSLTTTANWANTTLNATHWGLRDAETLFGSIPRSEPDRQRVQSLSGREIQIGYGRSAWQFGAMTTAQWYAARLLLAGSNDYSGSCLVQTRLDQISAGADVYGVYKAVVNFPRVPAVNRWGGYYQNIEIDFILIEAVTL